MPHNGFSWKKLFADLASTLLALFHAQFPFSDDRDVNPRIVALRNAFRAFPLDVDVVLIDGAEGKESPTNLGTVVRFDWTRHGCLDVRDHGNVESANLDAHGKLLSEVFGFDSALQTADGGLPSAVWEDDLSWFALHLQYDVRQDPPRFCHDVYEFLMEQSLELERRFDTHLDFNALYGLTADPVLADEKLLVQEERSRHIGRRRHFEPATLYDLQEDVANIKLIPQVTEPVQRTFALATKLYIFGYFDYGFFTISAHYAYLALDAALHARWTEALGTNVQLELRKNGKVTATETVPYTNHAALRGMCKHRKGWGEQNLWVNGEQYPRTAGMVVDSLLNKGIIGKWQHHLYKKSAIEIRNALTHLERAPITMPDTATLRFAAYEINSLFHSLPVPAASAESALLP